jgi:hypothetical protein
MTPEITCPKCSAKFPLDEALNRQLESNVRSELERQYSEKLATETAKLRTELQEKARDDARQELVGIKAKLEAKSGQLEKAHQNEEALLRKQAELEEQARSAKLEAQRTLAEEREKIRVDAEKKAEEAQRLKLTEKDNLINRLRDEAEELRKKAEQGSVQAQGDAQEIELESALRAAFPIDKIEPIKTGVRGADVIQHVKADRGQDCGSILWESKRVKHWQDEWIDKLREDMEAAKANVAVIVSDVLPDGVSHMGMVRGVWVTTFQLAVCFAATVRVNLAALTEARLPLQGLDDKKSLVYEYFTSPAFVQRMTTASEQILAMQTDLAKEKQATQRAWATREKRIQLIVNQTARFVGDLQALYGSALPQLPAFELAPEINVDRLGDTNLGKNLGKD